MQGRRTERVAHLLQEELGRLLLRQVKDPVIQGVTITDVRMSPDLSVAQVYYPASDGEQADRIRSGLERATPFLRRKLSAKLRLKKTPELRFLRDEVLEYGLQIDALLREINPPSREGTIEDAAQFIQEAQRCLVTTHLNPDGDAVGSMLALVHLLRDNGKEAVAFHPEPVPTSYQFLAGAEQVVHELDDGVAFDLLVVVDVAERERIAPGLPNGVAGAKVLVIDHHPRNGDLGDVAWRRSASAVGEMVGELARHLAWEVTPAFAECAYTALLTDTGSFRYASTTAPCLEMASWLVTRGAQPWKVASHVYESWPAHRVRLLGDVLASLDLACEGRLASLVVSQNDLRRRDAGVDLTEGFVNQGRRIEGVEVAVLFRELEPRHYRVSFRSKGRVDVGAIAERLGGGGHRNASGARLNGELEEIRGRVRELVDAALDNMDPADDSCWTRH